MKYQIIEKTLENGYYEYIVQYRRSIFSTWSTISSSADIREAILRRYTGTLRPKHFNTLDAAKLAISEHKAKEKNKTKPTNRVVYSE